MARESAEYQTLAEAIGVPDDKLRRMSDIGFKLYGERRYREAAAVFRGLTVLDPEDPELFRGLALSAIKDNDLLVGEEAIDAAVSLLEKREGTEEARAQLLAMLTGVLYRSGRRQDAVKVAERALELSPSNAPWIEALKGGAKRAMDLLTKTGGARPTAETSSLKRVLRARLAEVGRGQQTLARALGYGDRDLLRVYENGAALLDAGQPLRAERIFEGLVALDGGIPLFHLALATAREVSGEHASAAESYTLAVDAARIVPGGVDLLADALLRRARHAYKRGRKRAVESDVDEALMLPSTALSDDQRALAQKLKAAVSDRPPPSRAPDPSQAGGEIRRKKRKKKKKSSSSSGGGISPTSTQNARVEPAKIDDRRSS